MDSEQAVLVNEGVVLENWLVINDYREQLGLSYQDMNRVFGGLNALVKIFDKLELESRGDLQNGKPIEIGYSDELDDALGLFLLIPCLETKYKLTNFGAWLTKLYLNQSLPPLDSVKDEWNGLFDKALAQELKLVTIGWEYHHLFSRCKGFEARVDSSVSCKDCSSSKERCAEAF